MTKSKSTRITGQLLTIIFLLLTMTSMAWAGRHGHYQPVSVEIVSDKRGVLEKYDAGFGNRNTQRNYVMAKKKERYTIRVQNHTNDRIGLVIAVDGRNIISGDTSHLKASERMYILGPHGSGEYEGWRTGKNRVNRFYFTKSDDSYAAAWEDYSAMGVIAVAVYESRRQEVSQHREKRSTSPLDRSRAYSQKQDPGTGFGETEWSPSKTVRFTPQNKPVSKEFIKYEWRTTLCKKGVISCRRERTPHERNRFWPEHFSDFGFAPFPPSHHFGR